MAEWPLAANIAIFLLAAGIIGIAGTRLAALADFLADRTGLGEAITGAVFLGASTSLAGITTSVTAAVDGHAQLAVSNALGGIAAQTVFLAFADMFHREANLEHAAASLPNILQGALLISLLSLVILAATGPAWTVFGVHPVTPILPMAYLFGLRLARQTHETPMWRPTRTAETRPDIPDEAEARKRSLAGLWIRFAIAAAIVAGGGWAVARSGEQIAMGTGVSESFVGALFTATATSLPELVTAVAAVRRGALTLAVGDIIGGNAFDTLFLAVADVPYREGSIYHAIGDAEIFLSALTMLMTGLLLMGLVRREKRGVANIGFESFLILMLFIGGYTVLAMMG